MAAPIISRNTGLLGSLQWATYNLQLVLVQGASVTWTATSLPPGLSINSGTGKISGAPTAPGNWNVLVKATNSDGSDQILLYIPIEATSATAGGDVDVAIDLLSLDVALDVPGPVPSANGSAAAAGPLLVAKQEDDLFFSVRLNKGGVNADLDVIEFDVTVKELDTESVLCKGGGGTAAVSGVKYFKKSGSGPDARYRVYLRLDGDLLTAALNDKADDAGTFFDGRLEFSWKYNNPDNATFGPATARRSSNTVPIRITRPQLDE